MTMGAVGLYDFTYSREVVKTESVEQMQPLWRANYMLFGRRARIDRIARRVV
jgi:hypothetical protein